MSKITLFPKGFMTKDNKLAPAVIPASNIELDTFLDQVRDGEYQDEILQYRSGKIEKLLLRGVTASGVFSYRNAKSLQQHSGFIAIDIDLKDNPEHDFPVLKEKLKSDPFIYSLHHSAGGYGIVCYIKIVSEKHLDSFISLEKFFADNYEIVIDKSCKNVDRYRFVSYDPDLYLNKKSRTWKNYLKKTQVQPQKTYVHSGLDMDFIFQQIADTGIDLTDSYHDWLKIGFALFSKYGEGGRQYFHLISVNSHKYDMDKCDKLYTVISKRKDEGITINSLFWLCQQRGLQVKTPRTEQIERIAKMRRKSDVAGNPLAAMESAKKYLTDIENITGQDVAEILEIVKDLPLKDINEKSDDLIADLKIFLDSHEMMFNEVTRKYEIKGEPMNDRHFNTLYIKSLEQVDNRIQSKMLKMLMESDHTKSYHPFQRFWEKYKHLNPSGNFEKVVQCFDYQQQYVDEDGNTMYINNYLEMFLKKWLLGIISSMNGTYSLLVLILTGAQNSGKTKFFRNLLPDDLKPYYAESSLDAGKDDEILMTKKILVMDDEYGGKSKNDAKKLKNLSSKQEFNVRAPYGSFSEDLLRLAVLCGTSNEDDVINDPTGNRRLIPVNVIAFDYQKFDEISKVDLFIELWKEWREVGDGWMLTKDEIRILNNSTRTNEQPIQEVEILVNYFEPGDNEGGNTHYLTNTDIKNILEKETEIKINPYKLGLALKSLGFQKKAVKRNKVVRLCYLCTSTTGIRC